MLFLGRDWRQYTSTNLFLFAALCYTHTNKNYSAEHNLLDFERILLQLEKQQSDSSDSGK